MEKYKNGRRMDDTTALRRYTSLDVVLKILKSQKLRLTRLDKFEDIFEGSVPKKQFDDQVVLFSSHSTMMMDQVAAHYPGMSRPSRSRRDPWEVMTERRRAKTRSAYASCWTWGEESESMYKLYCGGKDGPPVGVGLLLRTTCAKLEKSIAGNELLFHPINYRPYHTGDPFNDELDPFFHKRQGFAREQEVRILRYDHDRYLRLVRHLNAFEDDPSPPVKDESVPNNNEIHWVLPDIVEEITISPYVDPTYESNARAAIGALHPSLESRILLSELHERRFGPNF